MADQVTSGVSCDCWRVRLWVAGQVTVGGSVELMADQVSWRQIG
jgi:hypothetical protein